MNCIVDWIAKTMAFRCHFLSIITSQAAGFECKQDASKFFFSYSSWSSDNAFFHVLERAIQQLQFYEDTFSSHW